MFFGADRLSGQGIPYEYESFTHFGAFHYSNNQRPTLVPKNDSIPLEVLGSAKLPTLKDYLHINLLYCEGKGGFPCFHSFSCWVLTECYK